MKTVDAQTLQEFASPILTGLGYDLVDLEWKHEAGAWVLRVYIDFPEPAMSGAVPSVTELDRPAVDPLVSHEDCTRASRGLSAELDVAELIHHPFTLEVSSPGLNRALKRESDFRRFAGKKAKIRTLHPLPPPPGKEGAPGRRNFAGRLVGAEGGKLKIDVDGEVFEIAVSEVEKAHLQVEL